MPLVCSPRDSAAPFVSPLRGPAAPPVFPLCVLVIPATAPAPAPVLRAAEHLFSRLIRLHLASPRGPHRQHRCCRSCQVRQSTTSPATSLSPASVPRRAPTGPSPRLLLPEPFSALSPRSGPQARGVPSSHSTLSPPAPALSVASGSVPHLRRPPLTGRCSHRLSRWCCQRQRRPLTRAPSRVCAGPLLARRLYPYRLNRFFCQRQRYPLTRGPSRTCCGKQFFAGTEMKNKRLRLREPQNSIRFVVDERFNPLLRCFTGGQQLPRMSWYICDGNHLHWLGCSTRLVPVYLNCPEPVYR